MLSSGGSLRFKDFLSIRRAIPMGKLQAFVMLLGMDFKGLWVCRKVCFELGLVFLFDFADGAIFAWS